MSTFLPRRLRQRLLGMANTPGSSLKRPAETSRALHVRALEACLVAILALQSAEPTADGAAHAAYDTIRASGDVNAFVCSYRTYPELLKPALGDEDTQRWLSEVLMHARDEQIGSGLGFAAQRKSREPREPLSKREREVLDLLSQGLTNRQIAKALWITEGTAKVHVRHIFEKLGVRTRVEAAMKAATLDLA